jgi:hypothetical protein
MLNVAVGGGDKDPRQSELIFPSATLRTPSTLVAAVDAKKHILIPLLKVGDQLGQVVPGRNGGGPDGNDPAARVFDVLQGDQRLVPLGQNLLGKPVEHAALSGGLNVLGGADQQPDVQFPLQGGHLRADGGLRNIQLFGALEKLFSSKTVTKDSSCLNSKVNLRLPDAQALDRTSKLYQTYRSMSAFLRRLAIPKNDTRTRLIIFFNKLIFLCGKRRKRQRPLRLCSIGLSQAVVGAAGPAAGQGAAHPPLRTLCRSGPVPVPLQTAGAQNRSVSPVFSTIDLFRFFY